MVLRVSILSGSTVSAWVMDLSKTSKKLFGGTILNGVVKIFFAVAQILNRAAGFRK